jgi:hypothetical protein
LFPSQYLPAFTPEDWRSCDLYLYGIDLFNHGYWWEAHEALEDVWLAAGIEKISELEGIYLGVAVAELRAEVERCLREDRGEFSRIELCF